MLIKVNDININYEIYGQGSPIILLHGNKETHEIFDKLIEKLQINHTVYALDSRCHGKSDNPKDISYNLMAKDVIEFIKTLKIPKPTLYGFSDGGIVGLLIAIQEPKLLSKLIISGAQLNPNGAHLYNVIFDKILYFFTKNKLVGLMVKEPNIALEDLQKISIPVHVLAGEKDTIKLKHTKLIASNIKNSTLEIIKHENHESYIIHSDKIYNIIKKYLEE